MAAERDDNSYLWDMLAAARAVETFVRSRTAADYLADLMLRSAVERQIEIIGEAARHVCAAFQTAHAEIPWRPIQAQRRNESGIHRQCRDEAAWYRGTNRIAAIFWAMDVEIAALKQRRAKTADLKQGMMQEPLAGKTPLVTPQTPDASHV